MRTVAIIPARGGSKGIVSKNSIPLAGKPLITYTIEAAKKSGIFDVIAVSTDDKKIELICRPYDTAMIRRPARLARDTTPTEPVLIHALDYLKNREGYVPQVVCLLQPTSPLRDARDIRQAYQTFTRNKYDSLLSVTHNTYFIWKKYRGRVNPVNYNYRRRPRRQEMQQLKENGALYFTHYRTFMKHKNRLGGKIGYYRMSDEHSLEIDSPLDLLVAETLLKRRGRGKGIHH